MTKERFIISQHARDRWNERAPGASITEALQRGVQFGVQLGTDRYLKYGDMVLVVTKSNVVKTALPLSFAIANMQAAAYCVPADLGSLDNTVEAESLNNRRVVRSKGPNKTAIKAANKIASTIITSTDEELDELARSSDLHRVMSDYVLGLRRKIARCRAHSDTQQSLIEDLKQKLKRESRDGDTK